MIITKIKLVNYRQHEHFEQDISGTVIAVVGANGSGKSNLLGGIQYAFTGEQPGFRKSALLRWGTKTGYVRIEFTHAGKECYIERNVHNTGVEFKYGDEVFTGLADVTTAITTYIGMDKDTARQSIFVRQAELDSILFTEPAARERAFQRLLGIGDADKIHRTLGEVLSRLPRPQDFDEYITTGEAQLTATRERIDSLQQQRDALQTQLNAAPTVEAINQRQAYLTNVMRCHEQLVRFEGEIAEVVNRKSLAQQELANVSLQGDNYDALRTRDNELADLVSIIRDYEQGKQALDKAQADYNYLSIPTYTAEGAAELKVKLDAVIAAKGQEEGRYLLHKNLYDALQKASDEIKECPVCGAAVRDAKVLSERLVKIMEEIAARTTTQRQEAAELEKQYVEMVNAINAWQTNYTRVSSALELEQARFDALPKPAADAPPLQQVQAELAEVQVKLQEEVTRISKRSALATQIQSYTEQHNLLLAKQVTVNTSCEGLQIKPEDVITPAYGAEVQKQLNDIPLALNATNELRNQMAGLTGMLGELEQQYETAATSLEDLKARKSAQNNVPDVVDVITQVRDWFHYSNGPRALSSMVFGALVDDINTYLDKFNAPFTVAPTADGTGFTYTYNDGRSTPEGGADASMLSGGQRVQLAIAFRYATYAMFAADLGVLSLDEPTTYLDENNVGRFCLLLEEIKKTAVSLNLQVWLATHERGVMPYVDTIIEVGESTVS